MSDKITKNILAYFQDFNQKLLQCNDTNDYIDQVVSVFAFAKLVESHFSELCQEDSSIEEALSTIQELQTMASALSETYLTKISSTESADLN